jgi:hypothetical protein
MAVFPAMSHPNRVVMRGTFPAAGSPDIVVAFPPVVAGDPDKSALRWIAAALNDRGRRPFAMVVLRKGSRRKQTKREQHRHYNFLDHEILLFGSTVAGVVSAFRSDGLFNVKPGEKLRRRKNERQERQMERKHTRASPLPGMRVWRDGFCEAVLN